MKVTMYGLPQCSTCRNAIKTLEDNKIKVEFIHIVDNCPDREKLEELYKKSEKPLKSFFNTSGIKYRELGLKDKLPTMTEDEMLDLLITDGKLIKRPLTFDDNQVTLGYGNAEKFLKLWQ